jgi:hypothetical protein
VVKVQVELQPDTADRYWRALAAIPGIVVAPGARNRIGTAEGKLRPLTLLPRPQLDGDAVASASQLARIVPRGAVGVVAAGAIPKRERDALEAVGLSWCDGRGAVHLAWPGTLIHIDQAGRRPKREPVAAAGLGPAGIRAVQVLLGTDDDEWTVSRLAREAAISVGQAHKVFKALEAERLLTTHGKGPQQRRRITDRRAALDWLATVDLARRRPDAAAAYLYARTPDQLLKRFAERAADAGLPYAVTGAAGSRLLGVPVLSQIVVAHIRVGVLNAVDALSRLGLENLDAEDAGRGMNLELWTDSGELGTFGASDANGVQVAPPVRVWLDLARQSGRSADAAQLFREQVLERA